jgi:hypothetical protein
MRRARIEWTDLLRRPVAPPFHHEYRHLPSRVFAFRNQAHRRCVAIATGIATKGRVHDHLQRIERHPYSAAARPRRHR